MSETNALGDYRNYAYDNKGELVSALAKDANGSNRLQEQLTYVYDAAGNLGVRTNNALAQFFKVNNLNELTLETNRGTLTVAGTTTSAATNVMVNGLVANRYADATFALGGFTVTNGTNQFTAIAKDAFGNASTNSVSVFLPATNNYSYDANGNLLGDAKRNFTYDDENQLTGVWVSNTWSNSFAYDGKMRRRIEQDFTWQGGSWLQTNEFLFIYDGNVVVEERNASSVQLVSYTRGIDLSGSFGGAGGIGGLLARTTYGQEIPGAPATAFYHADDNGNITALIYPSQQLAAKYLYDPFGNMLAMSGPLMNFNKYRFSSKEWSDNAALYYYAFRFYDPLVQRWLNRDPVQERGGVNLYDFVFNDPIRGNDPLGLFGFGDFAEFDICCPPGESEVTDDAGEECCSGSIVTVTMQTEADIPGHTSIFIGDDGYGYGHYPKSEDPWHLLFGGNGTGYNSYDSPSGHDYDPSVAQTFRACPKTVQKLRDAIDSHKNDGWSFICNGGVCTAWAITQLQDAGLNPETPHPLPEWPIFMPNQNPNPPSPNGPWNYGL